MHTCLNTHFQELLKLLSYILQYGSTVNHYVVFKKIHIIRSINQPFSTTTKHLRSYLMLKEIYFGSQSWKFTVQGRVFDPMLRVELGCFCRAQQNPGSTPDRSLLSVRLWEGALRGSWGSVPQNPLQQMWGSGSPGDCQICQGFVNNVIPSTCRASGVFAFAWRHGQVWTEWDAVLWRQTGMASTLESCKSETHPGRAVAIGTLQSQI